MAASKDYREELTAKLIEQLEAGTAPWQKPWDARSRLPFNATTDKPYRGVNSLYLTAVASMRGYEDPRWATYRQAAEKGWQVRKGEKGVGIEYWKHTDSQALKDAEGNAVRGKDGKVVTRETALARPRVFYATVFNLQQMEDAPQLATTQRSYEWDPLERAERILQSSGARLIHDEGDRAYYSPGLDQIHLPKREQFKNAAAYYGTALHELGHWSGHASRLNRDLSGAFGSPSYAKEELRAELASYFMSDQLGVPHDPSHHASYVKSWIKALADDKNEIFRAARDAERITEYVIALDREHEASHTPALSPIHRRSFESPDRNAVQEAVARAVEADPDYFLARFAELPQSLGGRFVSADLMKETFDQYRESKESRSRYNSPVHNTAAVLAAEQMRRLLKEPHEPGRNTVSLVTGVPGAGKTSIVLDGTFLPAATHAVYEGQLAEPPVAIDKVKQVLDAGYTPVILVVHPTPEWALDNTLERFEALGRGASVELMARIQGGLPEGLRAVRKEFGDAVLLQVIDRRKFTEPVLLEGWDHVGVLESEGTYEKIRQRLARHLETRRPGLAEETYRQAAGFEPQRTNRQSGEKGLDEREAAGDRREAPARDPEGSGVNTRLARALAFAELAETDAVVRHPELKPAYAALHAFQEALRERFADDSHSREQYVMRARAEILKKLDAGELPREVQVLRTRDNAVTSVPDQRDR